MVPRSLTVVGLKLRKTSMSLGSTGLSFSPPQRVASTTGSLACRGSGRYLLQEEPVAWEHGKALAKSTAHRHWPSIIQVWLAEAGSERHSHDSEGWG